MTIERHVPLHFAGSLFEHVNLRSIAELLLGSDISKREGRTARTLVKSEGLTVVLETLRPGAGIPEHVAPGPVTVVPLQGSAKFSKPNGAEAVSVGVGTALFISPGERHSVSASEDTAFLIVIGLQEGAEGAV